jgi:hypothetical protein
MFLSKESRQSARIMGHVLNFPLYDGDCSLVGDEVPIALLAPSLALTLRGRPPGLPKVGSKRLLPF